ncbi:MAG: hypothetical protein HQM16_19610 [Deltaproteobacteria bacterium]|nr:hypothetical protein [Deltaproteobacteria bacterium]
MQGSIHQIQPLTADVGAWINTYRDGAVTATPAMTATGFRFEVDVPFWATDSLKLPGHFFSGVNRFYAGQVTRDARVLIDAGLGHRHTEPTDSLLIAAGQMFAIQHDTPSLHRQFMHEAQDLKTERLAGGFGAVRQGGLNLVAVKSPDGVFALIHPRLLAGYLEKTRAPQLSTRGDCTL